VNQEGFVEVGKATKELPKELSSAKRMTNMSRRPCFFFQREETRERGARKKNQFNSSKLEVHSRDQSTNTERE
jgi:hypothetical protein